jgi:pilus assembly protein Flp/PilA
MDPFTRPRGQGLMEYALVIVLVALIVVVLLSLFGVSIGNIFSNVVANF